MRELAQNVLVMNIPRDLSLTSYVPERLAGQVFGDGRAGTGGAGGGGGGQLA